MVRETSALRSDIDSTGSDYGINSGERQLLVKSINTSDTSESVTISGINHHGLPLHRAIVVVANAALGAGMLNFPEAYGKTGGIMQAMLVQAVFIVLILGAFFILGYCGQVHRTTTYQDTVRDLCGTTAQIICQILVVLYMFGCNVTHMILIGDQLSTVIDQAGQWYGDRKFIIIIVCCLFVLPLCIPERLRVVSYSSLFGGVGAFYICGLVILRYYTNDYRIKESHSPSLTTGTQIFAAVPVICFGFQCHVTAVAVFAELKRPTFMRYNIVTVCATAICTIIYSLTGVFGYLTFGDTIKSDILVNYNRTDIPALAGRAVVVIVVFSTFAICQFVGRSALIGLWIRLRKLTVAQVDFFKNKRRIITSLLWFFSALAIAIFVPTIGKAIAIVGALAAHFIFTFPGLCLIQVILQDGSGLSMKQFIGLFIGVFYVACGMFLFGGTVTLALMEDIEGESIH